MRSRYGSAASPRVRGKMEFETSQAYFSLGSCWVCVLLYIFFVMLSSTTKQPCLISCVAMHMYKYHLFDVLSYLTPRINTIGYHHISFIRSGVAESQILPSQGPNNCSYSRDWPIFRNVQMKRKQRRAIFIQITEQNLLYFASASLCIVFLSAFFDAMYEL